MTNENIVISKDWITVYRWRRRLCRNVILNNTRIQNHKSIQYRHIVVPKSQNYWCKCERFVVIACGSNRENLLIRNESYITTIPLIFIISWFCTFLSISCKLMLITNERLSLHSTWCDARQQKRIRRSMISHICHCFVHKN